MLTMSVPTKTDLTSQNEAHNFPKIAFPFCGGALKGSKWAHLNCRWAPILFCRAQKVSGRKWQRNLGLGKKKRPPPAPFSEQYIAIFLQTGCTSTIFAMNIF